MGGIILKKSTITYIIFTVILGFVIIFPDFKWLVIPSGIILIPLLVYFQLIKKE
ncbi:hypothetical protein FC85_GL000081 [Lentilactobacillus diolivorans DSM 14421]|uniref:Uncharacterized protein n=1 Tax=Lentilactobacillus diolivorans DSM 14421 TaxID=1423739 RepID=A0A0R1SKY4_9LACO|nr:hypothetical protein FC85_GL000081 [Lentilactobacillus diolivorans DSM 14421]